MIDPTQLGTLGTDELTAALRPLWEDAGPLVATLVGRAVNSWEEHLDVAEAAITSMDAPTQTLLLGAHPRIGADPSRLSPLSYEEQGGGTPAEAGVTERLNILNEAYEQRFGFPFVEWVAGREKAAILAVLEQRLARAQDEEREAGCRALVEIARDRFSKLRTEVS